MQNIDRVQVLTRRPLVSSTRVCTPTGVPDCRGPCDGCGEYCEQVSQSWCDLSHSISTLVSEKIECDFNNDEGPLLLLFSISKFINL